MIYKINCINIKVIHSCAISQKPLVNYIYPSRQCQHSIAHRKHLFPMYSSSGRLSLCWVQLWLAELVPGCKLIFKIRSICLCNLLGPVATENFFSWEMQKTKPNHANTFKDLLTIFLQTFGQVVFISCFCNNAAKQTTPVLSGLPIYCV